MGDPRGFLTWQRKTAPKQPPIERTRHFREFDLEMEEREIREQGGRCMDCGVPFCNWGCPLGNLIPEWNDLVYRGDWKEATRALHATNSFPEFTGRVCPAPCEPACVLGITDPPVAIKQLEVSIAEKGFKEGFIRAYPPPFRTGKRVAVVGSGPSGLAAADVLNKLGHTVTVFERADRIGGLLMYGIPDFKLEKRFVHRRIKLMEKEGVEFRVNANVGADITIDELWARYQAIVLCGGATQPRDLPIPGRDLPGIHFAMEFLTRQNRLVAGDDLSGEPEISAAGKRVVVLGGGDTGSDCVGTSIRQGAKSIVQIELLNKPPEGFNPETPWPFWPQILRTSTSHEEGCDRDWSILTKAFSGNGRVERLECVRLDWQKDSTSGRMEMKEMPGSEFTIEADLVLLALGFLGPEKEGLLDKLGVEFTERGAVKTGEDYQTSVPGVFAAGDLRRGQSLVVWAIAEGRAAAESVHRHLLSVAKL